MELEHSFKLQDIKRRMDFEDKDLEGCNELLKPNSTHILDTIHKTMHLQVQI